MMNKVIRILIALLCLPLLGLGLAAMFNPVGMGPEFAVEPQSIHALNTIRGNLGGLLLSAALITVIGLWCNNTTWFLATAVIMGTVAFGRLIGFVFDGVDMATVPAFVIELVIIGVMVLAYQKLVPEKSNLFGSMRGS